MRRLPRFETIRLCRNCGLEVEDGEDSCPVDDGRVFLERTRCAGCSQQIVQRPCPTCLSQLPKVERLMARGLDWFDRIALPAARKIGDEGRDVARETGAHTARLTRLARLSTGGFSHALASERESLRLARAMVDARLGEPRFRDRIMLIDDALRNLDGPWNPRWSMVMERKGLLLALARAAVEHGEAPKGLETEFAFAVEASLAASKHREEVAFARSGLLSPDGNLRRRALVGALIVVGLGLLIFFLFWNRTANGQMP
jgi:hypothetical protein